MGRAGTRIATAVLTLALGLTASAQETPPPRVALVLSGGGARGAAHIGVLRVLEELHVAPDIVVGTSMGAIVGGLYAAGWSPEQIDVLLQSVDWNRVFTDRVPRNELSFRRKQDQRPVLIATRLHFDGFKPYIPSGLLGGQSLELLLRSLEVQSVTAQDFDDLPIPFRAVATDIATGEAVVLDSGSIATAMRASMSIPGAFPPVKVGDRELVDGGSVANLPVGIAKALGAEVVIAVDISSPLMSPGEKLGSFLAIYNQLNSLLTVGNRARDVERLEPGDVYIQPELGDISFVDFKRAAEAVSLGEQAARVASDQLRPYSVSAQEWAAFSARQRARPNQAVEINRVRLDNTSRVGDRIVRRALTLDLPAEIDPTTLQDDLLELYNLRYFGTIAFRIEESDGERELVVTTPARSAGRGSLQFGLSFGNDFEGESSHTVTFRHQLLAANRSGGEWQNILQLGSVGLFASEFYQPLDSAMRFFVAPSVELRREERDIWVDGRAVAQYRRELAEARLDAGRVLGNWGEVRLGAFSSDTEWSPRIGSPVFPAFDERRAGAELAFRVDTVNTVAFPRSGLEIDAWYSRSSSALGAESEFERVFASVASTSSWGEYTFAPYLEYGTNLQDAESLSDLFFLGGAGRLSALGSNELYGEKVALLRLAGYRRFLRLDLAGIRVRVYGGLLFEAGNVYDRTGSVTLDSLVTSWAAYVGADSPIGPMILGYARAEGGRDRVFVAMGDRF